ncbi:Tetratricopeptide repeat-containing protein [Prosthecobacter debontii]|uniref:Tetratricopeptide repeat-containing protein n=1 Tax=Prosthecobacter debontii TaxID=48467 RepID=A0A1T4YUC1_9BACT|nr:tetratricopeptide repeat protein [Prosthecobacter debontii]SKB04861.1 Tetratricopeptide repeat-containing protein [Prosthecobacter debontii]
MSASLSSFSNLLDNHAATLLREGKLDEALSAATSALSGLREAVEDEPAEAPRLFTGLQVLGDIQREMGDAAGSEASYGEALEIAGKTTIPPSQVARARTQLATLLDFSQREAEAAPLYEQAISDYEALTPPNEEVAAQLRNNLAMIYKGLGKYALAEQHYLRALEALENRRGRETEEVASVYNNLGSLYYTAGFPDQAKEMFTEALDIRMKLLGTNHPDVAQSYCNLATACHELGDNPAAILNYENSLRILEQHLATEAVSYEAVGQDYISLLDSLGEERKAQAARKRLDKVLSEAA